MLIVFAGKLAEQRKHGDAATVLEQYAQVNSVPPVHTPSPPTINKQGLPTRTLVIMKLKGTVGI